MISSTPAGPVLFRQERVGRDGEPFEVLKFRTMVVDAEARLAELRQHNEADGPLFKIRHDPRITRVGRFLRKTSLDELPQLWNVLRGEMSLVGPRPALPEEAGQWDARALTACGSSPGITGMWQVTAAASTDFEEYIRLDLYYVDNWSLPTDLDRPQDRSLGALRARRPLRSGRLAHARGGANRRGRERARPTSVCAAAAGGGCVLARGVDPAPVRLRTVQAISSMSNTTHLHRYQGRT